MSAPGTVFTLYEAKSKLSELVRRARSGERVTISYRGEPAVELVPIAPRPAKPSVEERLAELERSGAASPALGRAAEADWSPLAQRPGGLARFLAERGE